MPAVDALAASVRVALADMASVREVRMFGGICFMLNGNMVAAASPRGFLVRVGKEGQHDALSRPGTRPMEMRGRVREGYVYVAPPALTADAMQELLQLALAFVATLPPRAPGSKRARIRRRSA
jgi:TfoX/Sxy family transcriptional regulator of competence genes